MSPLLVLDLDGTLIDSLPDLAAALNRILAARGLSPLAEAEIRAMVGGGARRLVDEAFRARGVSPDPAALDDFIVDYTDHATVATRPFPGVPETLGQLAAAGWALALCTNKPLGATRRIVETLGLAERFAAIGAGDSYPTRKPDPRHLLATIDAAGGTAARSVMVGDHSNDVLAARGAGVACVFALWGYGPAAMAAGSTATATRFSDLVTLAPPLVGGIAGDDRVPIV